MRAEKIITATAHEHGVTVDDLRGPSKRPALVAARHAAMLAIRQQTVLTLPEIGLLFRRDHSSVLYGIRRAAAAQGVEVPDPPYRARQARRVTTRPAREALAEVDRLLASGWTANLLQARRIVAKSAVHYWRTGKVSRVHAATLERLRKVPAICSGCGEPALAGGRWCQVGGCRPAGRWSWSRRAA